MSESPEPSLSPEDAAAPPLAPPRPRRVSRLKAFLGGLVSTRLDKSGGRIRQLALVLCLAYVGIGAKLIMLGLSHEPPQTLKVAADQAASGARPDLLDRNGEILATDVKTMSVFAEPRRIIDKDEAVELITAVLPDVDAKELRERLGSKKGFVWVKRQVTPKEQQEIFHLGLPGVGFLPENKRVYPNGPIGAHVIGFVDKDNIGIAGMEKYLDQQSLTDPHVAGFTVDPDSLKPVRLSLDLKATHALRDELVAGLEKFRAKAAAGRDHRRQYRRNHRAGSRCPISIPTIPRHDQGPNKDKINRVNVGVYEMGSTFKASSIAMALESGKVNLGSRIDARDSLRYGRFTIHDFHATHRVLTVPEVFTHSSNIGTARMALMVGVAGPSGLSEEDGPARSAAHRIAGKRRAARAQALGRTEHDDDRLRPGTQCRADPGVDGGRRAGQWRPYDDADLPDAQRRRTRWRRAIAWSASRPPNRCAISCASNATHGSASFANIEGYYVGGKTGTARQDRPRPLFATTRSSRPSWR